MKKMNRNFEVEVINFFSNYTAETRYCIIENDGATDRFYHGMFNRGKGEPKTPIFLDKMTNLGQVYPHTYKSKGWVMKMVERCRRVSETRTPFGRRTFRIVELKRNQLTGEVSLGNELKI